MEKVETMIDFFASTFTVKVSLGDRRCGKETLSRAVWERDREYLNKSNIHLWEQMWCRQTSPR